MRKKGMWWIILAGIVVIAGTFWGSIVSNVEHPKYKIVASYRSIEIRDYGAMIVAEVEVAGERDTAISAGFRILANYIFGNNLSSRKVAMTAPVTQQLNEKIAMTAPVTQVGKGNSWQVRFVMPASYTLATLPKPNDPTVKIREIEAKRFAVIRFSGLAGGDSLQRKTDQLTKFMMEKKMVPASSPIYAFYNPPWTLPFMRRNEIMIEVGC